MITQITRKTVSIIFVALLAVAMATGVAASLVPRQAQAAEDDRTPKALLCASDVLVFVYDTNEYTVGQTYQPPIEATESTTINMVVTSFPSSISSASDIPWYSNRTSIVEVYSTPDFASYKGLSNLSYWFSGCTNLNRADLSAFDTSSVTNMSNMFESCANLYSLDVSSFETSNVTNMSSMFSRSSAIKNIDVSSFDTSKVTNMSSMFYYCRALTSLDLHSFNTDNVTNMKNMFNNCSSLTSLDVSSFDTSKVKDLTFMFYCCKTLETIFASPNSWGSSDARSPGMFSSCSALAGGSGTRYSSSNVTITYARIDTEDTPGYFTLSPRPSIDSVQLILDGTIGVHINMTTNGFTSGKPQVDYRINDTGDYIEFASADVKERTDGEEGYYVVVPMVAKEMTDVITVRLKSGASTDETIYDSEDVSIAEYCDSAIENPDSSDALKTLCTNMLYYGGYAQQYFDYRTDQLAFKLRTDRSADALTAINGVEPTALSGYSGLFWQTPAAQRPEGISLYGCSLVLKNSTTVRYYFTLNNGAKIDDFTFTYNDGTASGLALTPTPKNSYFYVDVANVAAHKLGDAFTITATKSASGDTLSVTYSPAYYAYKMASFAEAPAQATATLSNLAKALHLYYTAAAAYLHQT